MGIFQDLFGGTDTNTNTKAKDETAEAPAAAPPEPTKEVPATPHVATVAPIPTPAPSPAPPPAKNDPRRRKWADDEEHQLEGVQRLVSRKVERVLEQLGTLAMRARTGEEVPTVTVTLHLAHGHTVTGTVVDYAPRDSVLLALGKEGLLGSESVTYVDLATVVAVTVGQASKLLELAQLVRSTPTRQDLLTMVEKLPHALTEQFWPGETALGGRPLRFEVDWMGLDDEPGRRALESALNVTNHALRALAQEQGREVMRRIATVRFVRGKAMRAALEGETGTVTVGEGEPTVSAFRKAFASGLK
ncbi:hypothetical protein [Myxococcus qinghaiensis]|uniref:hypothetical protein n=1 Tax=Myxococcus qinghaiensis TaxID=2906758 RepID=UPI0020A7F12E|nr:hypothetical protein [Myxococcus qinghaiensis]MCP3164815.1 hypothetical protein [Myxococcus qinghaiensis]